MADTIEVIKVFTKAPRERLDFSADYSKELARDDDTLASSIWVLPSDTVDAIDNLTLFLSDAVEVDYDGKDPYFALAGDTGFTTTLAFVWIDGGTPPNTYTVENHVVTARGRKYQRRFKIRIVHKSGI